MERMRVPVLVSTLGCLLRGICKGISCLCVCSGTKTSASNQHGLLWWSVLYEDPGSLCLLPKMLTTEKKDCHLIMHPKQVEEKMKWKLETGEIAECWIGSWRKQHSHSSLLQLNLTAGKLTVSDTINWSKRRWRKHLRRPGEACPPHLWYRILLWHLTVMHTEQSESITVKSLSTSTVWPVSSLSPSLAFINRMLRFRKHMSRGTDSLQS